MLNKIFNKSNNNEIVKMFHKMELFFPGREKKFNKIVMVREDSKISQDVTIK